MSLRPKVRFSIVSFYSCERQKPDFSKGANLESNDLLLLSNKTFKRIIDPFTESKGFWQSTFETSPIARLLVKLNSRLIGANKSARTVLNISVKDLGYPLQKLPLFTQLEELNFQVEGTGLLMEDGGKSLLG